ncbi:MAG: tyrosine-type recombinase/integrase [Thermoleophilia bacterium]|jgi:site-specific recombinase XerD|nr:tyrosine-type recombinase/integrase [Thermoleophilia bacterium]
MPRDAWDRSLAALAARLAKQGGRGRALAEDTQAGYVRDCRLIADWLRAQGVPAPEEITPSALEAALAARGWGPATRRRALTAAREWLGPLFPRGRCPADLVDPPRRAPRPVPRLSQPDAIGLADRVAAQAAAAAPRTVARAIALRDRAIIEVLYGSGLRRQEVCDLSLAGLDFEHETLRLVGKGGRARTVPLTEPAVDALREWLVEGRPRLAEPTGSFLPAGRARVFLSRTGRPLDGSTVYRMVARELRAMGRAGGPHLLRHAAATHLLEGPGGRDGAHLRVVQEVLGHRSLATTQRYTGVTTKALQQTLRQAHPRG